MIDVMKPFKENKFVVFDHSDELFEFDDTKYKYRVIFGDISYWHDHHDNIKDWCRQNECRLVGISIDIPTDDLLTLFRLRWL